MIRSTGRIKRSPRTKKEGDIIEESEEVTLEQIYTIRAIVKRMKEIEVLAPYASFSGEFKLKSLMEDEPGVDAMEWME